MQYARIASGVVAELFDTADDITHLFAPQLVWVATNNDPGAVVGAAYADGVFTAPTVSLDDLKSQQTASVRDACQQAIFAGFASDALGVSHSYPAKATDQTNLQASVLASLLPGNAADWTTPFWCADSSGAWAYVSHTAAQIQQAGRDGKAAILAALVKCQTLEAAISSATTPAQVQAVVWQF